MVQAILAPVGAWEDSVVVRGGGNRRDDVIVIQTLLTAAARHRTNPQLDPKGIDGQIRRAPGVSGTLTALYAFQQQFLSNPDRRVDVGGTTWKELAKFDGIAPGPEAGPAELVNYAGQVVPFFKQFDAAWGTRTLGSSKTLTAAGCAITSIAMILKFYGRDMDPGKLDEYLDSHQGYVGDNVVWDRAFEAGAAPGKPTLVRTNHAFTDSGSFTDKLNERIDKNWPTLAHIDYGSDANVTGDHWVVVVGRTPSGKFIINDPGTSQGDGASNPYQSVTILGESTRKGGLNLVRLCLFDVA